MRGYLTCLSIVFLDVVTPVGCGDDRMRDEQQSNTSAVEAEGTQESIEADTGSRYSLFNLR